MCEDYLVAETCEHLVDLELEPIEPGGCIECLAIGGTWVHLRYCTTCKTIRCCDSSPNQHASKHAAAHPDHPVVRSAEPNEYWAYCYVDEVAVSTDD